MGARHRSGVPETRVFGAVRTIGVNDALFAAARAGVWVPHTSVVRATGSVLVVAALSGQGALERTGVPRALVVVRAPGLVGVTVTVRGCARFRRSIPRTIVFGAVIEGFVFCAGQVAERARGDIPRGLFLAANFVGGIPETVAFGAGRAVRESRTRGLRRRADVGVARAAESAARLRGSVPLTVGNVVQHFRRTRGTIFLDGALRHSILLLRFFFTNLVFSV